jgi:hypothetical protein
MSEQYIYSEDKEINTLLEDEYFTVSGLEDYLDINNNPRVTSPEDNKILAKKVTREDSSTKYSIKIDSNGKIYNPVSMYVDKESFLDKVCRGSEKFKEVNFKIFNMYIHFLRTKNLAWINNAEREKE